MANGHWPLLLYKPYTSDTRWVKVFQSVYSYTTLYSIQLYIAIHYTPSTTPLCPLSALSGSHTRDAAAERCLSADGTRAARARAPRRLACTGAVGQPSLSLSTCTIMETKDHLDFATPISPQTTWACSTCVLHARVFGEDGARDISTSLIRTHLSHSSFCLCHQLCFARARTITASAQTTGVPIAYVGGYRLPREGWA